MDDFRIPFQRIYAYLRKSRSDGDTETVEEVLAKHENMLQEYMLRVYNAELPQDHIFREVMSGETIAARPVMQMLIGMIQNGRVDGLFVVDLQRISRGDLSDAGEFSRLFRYTKCKIITPQRIFDISDEYDRKFFETELMRANDYLEYTKKIMGRGRVQSVKNGNFIGSIPPYGYDKAWIDKRPTLVPNPAEADVVRLIFDLYANSNMGPHSIAHHLDSLGIPTRSGKTWASVSVRDIVENPVYMGYLRWNWRAEKHTYVDGKISKSRPRSTDYILSKGTHEPLISEETFEKARAAAKSRAKPSVQKPQGLANIFAGVLYCRCGYVMTYKLYKNSKYTDKRVPYMVCSGRGCNCRSARFESTLDVLIESMKNTLEMYEAQLDEVDTAEDTEQRIISSYEKELSELKQQQQKLYDFLERGIYSEEVFIERSALLKKKAETLTAKLHEIREESKKKLSRNEFCTSLSRCIDILPDPNVSAEEKNALLKKVVQKIIFSRGQTTQTNSDIPSIDLRIFYNI